MRLDDEELREATEAALKADREAGLRDVFACSAMAALISRSYPRLDVAHTAYWIADQMLEARRA